jgi:hypothetical protein
MAQRTPHTWHYLSSAAEFGSVETDRFGVSIAWETIEWNGHSSAINLEIYKIFKITQAF